MAINIHAIVKVDLQKQKKIHLDKSKASVMKLNFLTFGKEWCIAWKRKKGIKENDPLEISQAPEVKLSLLTRQPGVPFEILSGKYRARREKQRNEEQKMVTT